MDRYVGKIAEYGTEEFNNNQAVFTILDSGTTTNPNGITRKMELYHRTQGYKDAGSCATWGNEIWGVKIYFNDGTTGGQMFLDMDAAKDYFYNRKN